MRTLQWDLPEQPCSAVVGAAFGALDAQLRGYAITDGIVGGVVMGIAAPEIPIRLGIGFAVFGVGEALWHQDYDSALFRAATFGFGYILQTRGFQSFREFKESFGPAGNGRGWHHIVEQNPTNVAKFSPEQIHNPSNLTPLPEGAGSIHSRISGFYQSKQSLITGPGYNSVRAWLSQKSYVEQYQFGLEALQRFGGTGPFNLANFPASWTWPAVLEAFDDDSGFGGD